MAAAAPQESGLRLGSFAGAAIIVDSSLVLLAAFVLGSAVLNGGLETLPFALITLGAILLAVLLHEFGHAAMAAALGVRSKRIVLTFFGGFVQFETPPQMRWHEIAVAAAGPLTNLACAWLVDRAAGEAFASSFAHPVWSVALSQFAYVSLLLGAFNLIPALPLDGGHILRSFLNYFLSRPRASMVGAGFGVAFALALAAFGAIESLWLTVMIAVLLGLSAWAEIQRSRAALRADQGAPSSSNA